MVNCMLASKKFSGIDWVLNTKETLEFIEGMARVHRGAGDEYYS